MRWPGIGLAWKIASRSMNRMKLKKMGHAANQIMLKHHPEPITTFVIGRNVNYTNICDVYCRFCAFYRAPGSKEGYVLPDDVIFQKKSRKR